MRQDPGERLPPVYENLDPRIRETVRFLNLHGFQTTDSGDGRTKGEDGLEWPHVAMVVPRGLLLAEAWRLHALLPGVAAGDIQATYDPVDDSSILLLLHVDDERLKEVAGKGRLEGEKG